jgi:hypothetical protein
MIGAHRNLTAAIVADLKSDSANFAKQLESGASDSESDLRRVNSATVSDKHQVALILISIDTANIWPLPRPIRAAIRQCLKGHLACLQLYFQPIHLRRMDNPRLKHNRGTAPTTARQQYVFLPMETGIIISKLHNEIIQHQRLMSATSKPLPNRMHN